MSLVSGSSTRTSGANQPYLPGGVHFDSLVRDEAFREWVPLLNELKGVTLRDLNFASELERINNIYVNKVLLRGGASQVLVALDKDCRSLHRFNKQAIKEIPHAENAERIGRIFRQFGWISRRVREEIDVETCRCLVRSLSTEALQSYLEQYINSSRTNDFHRSGFIVRLEQSKRNHCREDVLDVCLNSGVAQFIGNRVLEEEALSQLKSVSEVGRALSVMKLLIDVQISYPSLAIHSSEGRRLIAQAAGSICERIFPGVSTTDFNPVSLLKLREKIYRLTSLCGADEQAMGLFNDIICSARANKYTLSDGVVWSWLHSKAVTLKRLNTFFDHYEAQFNRTHLRRRRLEGGGAALTKLDLFRLLRGDEKNSMIDYIRGEILMQFGPDWVMV